jgi:hypothetical protein
MDVVQGQGVQDDISGLPGPGPAEAVSHRSQAPAAAEVPPWPRRNMVVVTLCT